MGPPVSSVRNLEKVGDLETLQFWSNQTLVFLTFTDLHLRGQTVSDYHPLFFFNWGFVECLNKFLDAMSLCHLILMKELL